MDNKFKLMLKPRNRFCVMCPDGEMTHTCAYDLPLFFSYKGESYIALSDYCGKPSVNKITLNEIEVIDDSFTDTEQTQGSFNRT